MTREEAKTVFLNRGYVEVEGGTIYDADKWRESCRVISEWLEQEPYDDARYHEEHCEVIVDKAVWEDAKRALEQEPSGDAVSREAVLNELDKELYSHNAKMAIKAIPSAEPKTGQWIEHPEIKTITPEIMFYECSECGVKQCFCKSDIHKKHFCNYCGARMVEPTCDTCEYNTAAFNPCNACKDKSEYKPLERSEKG